MSVSKKRQPKIAHAKDPLSHRLAPKVTSINAMMAFAKHLVSFVSYDVAEEDPVEGPLIQHLIHEEVLPCRSLDTRFDFVASVEAVSQLCEIPHYVTIPLIVNERMGRSSLNRQDGLIGERVVNGSIKGVRDRGIRKLLGHYHALL